MQIFRSAFAPLLLESGADLTDLVCRASTGPDGDYAGFHVALLRRGTSSAPLCAAAVRAHGPHVAELPFLATRDGARRQGHARRLLTTLEALLTAAGVRRIVVPAATQGGVKKLWVHSFGYTPLPLADRAALGSGLVELDGTVFVGKWLAGARPPPPPKPQKAKAAASAPAARRRPAQRAAAAAATAAVARVVSAADDGGAAEGDAEFEAPASGGGGDDDNNSDAAPAPCRRAAAAPRATRARARPAPTPRRARPTAGTVTLGLLLAALRECGATVATDQATLDAARLAAAAAQSEAAVAMARVTAALAALEAGDEDGARAALEAGVVVVGQGKSEKNKPCEQHKPCLPFPPASSSPWPGQRAQAHCWGVRWCVHHWQPAAAGWRHPPQQRGRPAATAATATPSASPRPACPPPTPTPWRMPCSTQTMMLAPPPA